MRQLHDLQLQAPLETEEVLKYLIKNPRMCAVTSVYIDSKHGYFANKFLGQFLQDDHHKFDKLSGNIKPKENDMELHSDRNKLGGDMIQFLLQAFQGSNDGDDEMEEMLRNVKIEHLAVADEDLEGIYPRVERKSMVGSTERSHKCKETLYLGTKKLSWIIGQFQC